MKFLDFFAGIGGFRRGMELAGHECVGFCEFDKFATASYTSMHLITDEQREYLATLDIKKRQKEILKDEYRNGEWYCNDIRSVDIRELPKADCWCFGFPCFVAGTMILTSDGYKKIEDVKVGDLVLTHKGNWKEVIDTMSRENAEVYEVDGFGILPTETTAEHPYYVTDDGKTFDFLPVKDLTEKMYSTIILPKEEEDNHSEAWWWLAGRYLADGWRVRRKDRKVGGRVVFAINDAKRAEFEKYLSAAGYHATYSKEKTCPKHTICNNELYRDLEIFGKYAHGKAVPKKALCLEKKKAEAFYNGYMAGDGRKDREEATSVSPALILGMCMIALKIGKPHPGVYKSERPGKCIIEGRECNQRTTYMFRISERSVKSFESNGYVCRRISRADRTDRLATVYNISVADDQSYIANGAIVHNCQDISIAGKQAGFKGNRSSLFFRVMGLLGQLEEEERPEWLFIENVKNLFSINGGWDFARVLTEMDKVGYDAEWELLNSKDFGVPQNRERVFVIGHLRARGGRNVFPLEPCDTETSELQGCEDRNRVITNTLDTRIEGLTRGTYPIVDGGGTAVKVSGYHKR